MVRKKEDNNRNELFNAWLIASFERYSKRNNFGYSFMNEVDFEKVQMAFKSDQNKK